MRHRLEYAFVKALFVAVRLMPDPLVRAAGTLLGRAVYTFDRAHRRIAHRNLASAFPSRTERQRKAIARAAFSHFGRMLVELLKFSTLSDEAMLARVEFDGEDRARLAYAQGRGVLFFTGHFGFWELHALVHALTLEPFTENTITSKSELAEQLPQIRARGWAIGDGERIPDAFGIAVPYFVDGNIAGSLTATMPRFRATHVDTDRIATVLTHFAQRITRLLSVTADTQ